MIGIGFLWRLLQLAVALVVAASLITGFFYLATWILRLMWDAFERNFEIQARWLRDKAITFKYKIPLIRPGKIGCAVFSVIVMMLCIGTLVFWAIQSGNDATGVIIP